VPAPSPGTAKLSLQGVRKEFGAVVAVDDLSLEVFEGEFLSLLGPSGCGKSTTLAMIAGFETPMRGAIHIDGVRVNGLPPQARKVGLVFQDYAIFTKMTVFDNIAFGLHAHGAARAETRMRVHAMADFLDVRHILGTRADRLDMSELQRVALGRALVLQPSLLLLDEPLSNLDAAFRTRLRGELRSLQRRLRQTVVYVTHDHVEAMAMSDRIAVMDRGRILQIDSPSGIYHRPRTRFVAEFLGEPPINLIPCKVHRGPQGTRATSGPLDIACASTAADGDRWLLGVRPHEIRVLEAPAAGAAAATVDLVEPLGPETIVHLRVGAYVLLAVMPPARPPKPGETRWITIAPESVRLVKADTGEVVS
jgi:multiple sugar transport system ATP-binding protein